MNAPHALVTRSPFRAAEDERTDLTALLDLFSAEEPAGGAGTVAPRPPRPSLREAADRLVAWVRESSRRAAAWGAGPQGAWRAW